MKARQHFAYSALIMAAFVGIMSMFTSCDKKLDKTEVMIIDNNRHYFPATQGAKKEFFFELRDTTDIPIYIEEVQPSAGLFLVDELPITVLPDQPVKLHFVFDTSKNIGLVKHYVNIYANFVDSAYRTLYFDINVVLPADYYHDYEQLFFDNNLDNEINNGNINEKGYITDEDVDDDKPVNAIEEKMKQLMKM